MAIDLERTMDRVLQMAENAQKARGIDNFGSDEYRNNVVYDKAAAQRAILDQQLLDKEKLRVTERMTTRGQDVENAKAEAALANASAVAQAKNQNALQVAAIRANGGALGRKDPSVLSANERMQAALEIQKNNSLPGKPMSIDDAVREVDRINGGQSQVTKNADGTIAAAETPEQRAQRQALVPGHKNDPLGRAVDPSTVGVNTPKGEAPTALSANQWQQYADSKSPGMKYEGNQPGMVGDQIARFKRADGSAFFANTGAVKMQMGDALTPAPTTPLVNTPGVEPRATMPDAANRSAMNTAKRVAQKESSVDLNASGLNRAGWSALAPNLFKNTNWSDASLGAGMTRDTGEDLSDSPTPSSAQKPTPEIEQPKADPYPAFLSALKESARRNTKGNMPSNKPGLLEWLKEFSRRRTPGNVAY